MAGREDKNADGAFRRESLYGVLEVDRLADEATIKKAYRRAARKHHPDKNPGSNGEQFKRIVTAFRVLSDPVQRRRYDELGTFGEGGEGGTREGGNAGEGEGHGERRDDPWDLFRNLFSSNRRRAPQHNGRDRGASTMGAMGRRVRQHTCSVRLEELFGKRTKHLRLTRVIVVDSAGRRARGGVVLCDECGGEGVRRITRRSSFMVQQFEQRCPACEGQGRVVQPGYSTQQDQVDLAMDLSKWTSLRGLYRFPDTGSDLSPVQWDTMVTVELLPHDRFRRSTTTGSRSAFDLEVHVSLDWREALFGFRRIFIHLDNKPFLLEVLDGRITPPGVWHRRAGHEMGMRWAYI